MTTMTAPARSSPGRPPGTSVAVFCGARPGTPEAVAAAREIGELIGAGGHRLVYGGGGCGLMGELAWSASDNGAEILGVTPRFLFERERHVAAPPQTVHVTDSMAERKRVMLDEADAFIALAGGYGTLDEVLDVIGLTYLAVHRKPLVLLQADGEWDGLVDVLAALVGSGYADPLPSGLFAVTDTAEHAMKYALESVPEVPAVTP